MYSPSGHQRCRWVHFFIRTDLEKFRITSLAHQWILCSEWVPSEWTMKKNITLIKKIIHESSTLMSCEMKSYTFLTLLPARTGLAKSLARRPGAILFSSRATKMYHRPAWRAPLNTGLPRNVPFTLRAHGRTLLQPRPRRRNNVPLARKN